MDYHDDIVSFLPAMTLATKIAELRKADRAYRKGSPLITDEAYDLLRAEVLLRAPYHPAVNRDVTALQSLDSRTNLETWMSTLGSGVPLIVQPKIDGCTLALRYTDGFLTDAWTHTGRCAMSTAKLIDVPRKLKGGANIEVHGELYSIEEGQSQKASAKSLNVKANGDGLLFSAFRIAGYGGGEVCMLRDLDTYGFSTPDYLCCTYGKQIRKLHQMWLEGRLFSAWPTDGIVIKAVDSKLQRRLGSDGQAPFWALAMKSKCLNLN
jgi:DNA ligase (NAD+)